MVAIISPLVESALWQSSQRPAFEEEKEKAGIPLTANDQL